MSVARKWHFSTSGGAANLGGVSGDLSEHHGSGIPLLGITSLNRHFYAQVDWTIKVTEGVLNYYIITNTNLIRVDHILGAETVPVNTSFLIIKDAFLLRCKLGKTIISIRAIWYNNSQSKCVKVKRACNARAFS